MTPQEYQKKLAELLQLATVRAYQEVIVPEANELLAETKNRIAIDGKKADGSKIGNYSTKGAYYSREQFVKKGKFKPVGKTGKQTKSTMYLPSGYKQLRDIQGRSTDKVNENYSGQTLLDYDLEPRDKSIVLGFVSERSSKIRKGQDKRFGGDIWHSSKEELDNYQKNVTEQTEIITQQILNA
jgi:hypothetical protein